MMEDVDSDSMDLEVTALTGKGNPSEGKVEGLFKKLT